MGLRVFTAQNVPWTGNWVEFYFGGTQLAGRADFFGTLAILEIEDSYGLYGMLRYFFPDFAGQSFQIRIDGLQTGSIYFDSWGIGETYLNFYNRIVSFNGMQTYLRATGYREAEVRAPSAGTIRMVYASRGSLVKPTQDFLRMIPEGTNSEISLRPANSGICTAVYVDFYDTVVANQLLGTYKYEV